MKRNAAIIALQALFVASALAAAPSQHKITPSEIRAEIQDRLYHAQVFKHGNVNIAYQDGVATLTGSVDCIGVKMDAGRAARRVNDVNQVVNQITINVGDTGPEGIVRQARKEILTYPFYTIFDWVVLEVNGHNLGVSGYVTQPYMKSDIGNFLEHIDGVTSLTNDLKVLPVSQFDGQVRLQVARAIYDDPNFIYYEDQPIPPIHIIVDNGNVTLDGVVASKMDKTRAGMDARSAATFFAFKNDLRVQGGS